MILVAAAAVAILFGAGTFLLLQRDLFRMVAGVIMISNAATLFLVASSLSRGQPPIHPLGEGPVSDPLAQALALTAIVIGFAVAALLLILVFRLFLTHHSIDTVTIETSDRRQAALRRREGDPEAEEIPDEEMEDAELAPR